MANDFRPIIGNGESYIMRDDPHKGLPSADKLPPYEIVRDALLRDIQAVRQQIINIPPEFKVEEFVVSLKMVLGYTAKSYHPNMLIRQTGATDIGSKKWSKVEQSNGKNRVRNGKIVFARFSNQELDQLQSLLHRSEKDLLKTFVLNARSIESIYLHDNIDLMASFSDWESGRVEIVLHPFHDSENQVVRNFIKLYERHGGDPKKLKIRSYSPGPTFISAPFSRDSLQRIIRYNPIRTAHPLTVRSLPSLRGGLTNLALPDTPGENIKSSIMVGMFDGGLDKSHPWLQAYVTERNMVPTEKHPDFLTHGTAVAGALLYGNLDKYSQGSLLPTPPINVESFRVFPLSDPKDLDLYEVIDVIEDVVPKRPDIKVYNLSIGPYGPIEDDYISRFTYVVDGLSEKGERLFVIAVGNDGELPDDESRRIQSPSDAVNAIGVGAYTYGSENVPFRAPYSSIGEGREGSKIKPDITAFGGSTQRPFQLLGLDARNRMFAIGTSFATPLVSAKAAEVIGRCNIANPLVARTLLIHSAKHPTGKHDRYLGYGIVSDDVDEILGCTPNKVTVLYKSRILPANYARLPIPVVPDLDYEGTVDISWTICMAVKTNPLSTEDYTSHCIEDTFYPHEFRYKFTSPDEKHTQTRHIIKASTEVQELISKKWKKGTYPVTMSGNNYQTEDERRANFKWDTVVKKMVNIKKFSDLASPYLVLHAMDRGTGEDTTFIEYAVAATVFYKDYKGDAYQRTLETYSQLEVAQIRSRNELLVRP